MTHSLPDDPDEWPASPFELLGVPSTATAIEIARAYTRLIRIFKPDFHPVEFRKIRDAYERVRRPRTSDRESNSSPTEPQRHRPHGGDAIRISPSQPESFQLRDNESLEDRYRKLVGELERGEGTAEKYQHLYWIAKLQPEVDTERDRRDWLVVGLEATRSDSTLLRLYSRELEWHEEELLHERVQSVSRYANPSVELRQILSRRWKKLCERGADTQIGEDIEELRPRHGDANRESWFDLLVLAAEHLIWSRTPAGRQVHEKLWREINSFWEFQLDHSETLNRFDDVENLKTTRDTARRYPSDSMWQAIENAISIAWQTPGREAAEITILAEAIAIDPRSATRTLQKEFYDCRFGFSTLANAFERILAYQKITQYDPLDDALADRVLETIHEAGTNPPDVRDAVVTACVREMVRPSHISEMIEKDGDDATGALVLADIIRRDCVARLVSGGACLARHQAAPAI